MKCTYCQTNSGRFDMNKLCCLARHVLGKFYGDGETPKKYAIEVAAKYRVDVNDLKSEVFKQMGKRKC